MSLHPGEEQHSRDLLQSLKPCSQGPEAHLHILHVHAQRQAVQVAGRGRGRRRNGQRGRDVQDSPQPQQPADGATHPKPYRHTTGAACARLQPAAARTTGAPHM